MEIGSTLGDSYIIEASVGRGGMAQVWRVRNVASGSAHACKVLHNATPMLHARLVEEGRVQAQLRHPNIVQVTDVIELGDSVGLIMELVEGLSLQEALDGGPLPLPEAYRLGTGILDGMAHAHKHDLIHRDLKPANVLLAAGPDGPIPRLVDFGLSRSLDRPQWTQTGLALGTPGFMPPEQYRDAGASDTRADVYALGCVLYAMVCGQPPFPQRDIITLFQMALRGDYPEPDDLAPALPYAIVELLHQALSPNPDDRFRDASVLRRAWQAALGQHVSTSPSPTPAPPPSPPSPAAHNLHAPPDEFVGRSDDLEALRALLDPAWLVTIIGVAGAGKTRLSLHLGLSVVSAYAGGVWFCDLSDAHTTEAVCTVVARVVGAKLGRHTPATRLGEALASRGPVLLILDNAEQVTEPLSALLMQWNAMAPTATFLVTSREVLGLPGERLFSLEPLGADAAVALFATRAAARKPGFSVTAHNRADIETLVALLDRLPLAIELAAARIRTMGPASMVSRMGERFRLLRSDRRGARTRQQTLLGALDWSWDLLEGWERAAFVQCSVFQGGFTLEAAEAVLDLSAAPDPPWPVDAIQRLVDRSLLRFLGEDALGQPRFGMFLSVHAYATRQQSDDDSQACSARHSMYYAQFGRPASTGRMSRASGAHWWALSRDLDNLQAAARWATQHRHWRPAGLAARAIAALLFRRGPFSTAETHLRAALSLAQEDAPTASRDLRARMRYDLGCLLRLQGRPTQAAEALEAALVLAKEDNIPIIEANASAAIGSLHQRGGRLVQARAYFSRSLVLNRQLGSTTNEANGLCRLGDLSIHQGQLAEATEHYEAALAVHRRIGNRGGEGIVLCNLAIARSHLGQPREARRLYEASLICHREVGHQHFEATVLSNLAGHDTRDGDYDKAQQRYEAVLAITQERGLREFEALTLGNLGGLCHKRGDHTAARGWYVASRALCQEIEDKRGEGIALTGLGIVDMEQRAFDEGRAHLATAAERFQEAGDRLKLGNMWCSLSVLEQRAGAPDAAASALAAAEEIARSLALDPDARLWAQIQSARDGRLPS